MRVFALLLLVTGLLWCADATGKWKGTLDAGGTPRELVFDLKANGEAVTGTVAGAIDRPIEIKEGKVKGDDVSFFFVTEYQGNPFKMICKGQVSGDEIRFTIGTEDGGWSANFVAKKTS